MTVREIQAHLAKMYGTEVSPSLISSVTDAVADEVKAWQSRPLDAIYPIVYLDCIHMKVREGAVRVKAVYFIGVSMTGEKEVLGLWLAQTEGAKFWLQVVTELRNRGVQDIFIACVDGLKDFPEAIEAVFPQTLVQLCIVHMVRQSLNYVSWKQRKQVAADLRRIYTAATADEAQLRLSEFERCWDGQYLPIGQAWLGLVPGQYSSGGKARLGHITKAGNAYMRSLLVLGARAVLNRAKNKSDSTSRWAISLAERRGYWRAIVAIAAKNARMAWASLTLGERFAMPA